MRSPQAQRVQYLTLQNDEGEVVGYAQITSAAMHDRIAASKIFKGTLTVYDADKTEIATINFSKQGTSLAFPGESSLQPIKSPMDNKDSMAFFQYAERIRDLLQKFAYAVIEQKDSREEMQNRLSEICCDLIDPQSPDGNPAPDRALAVSVRIPAPHARG